MVEITEMTNWAVDLIDVRKAYGRIEALRGVNIQVGRGEIFGLLGPNGAGKSTLVKIMMTVVRPDRMAGTILGRPLGHRKKLAVMGYLPEAQRLPEYLTARQLLDFFGAMAKVPRSERKRRIDPLLDRVGVLHRADQQVGKYSKGMLQRLGIAQALINDPEMVVLDEPTDGLDPVGRREVRELLLELKQRGKTVFLNSHLLSELETVCDRVSILMDGLVARQGRLNELTEATFEYRIAAEGDLAPLREKIESAGARLDGNSIVLPGRDRSKLNELIDLLRTGGHLIESVTPHRFSLEDIFLDATGGTAKGRAAPPVARPASGRK